LKRSFASTAKCFEMARHMRPFFCNRGRKGLLLASIAALPILFDCKPLAWANALPPASLSQAASQKPEAATLLARGAAVQSDLAVGERHRHQVNLAAGRWVELKIERHGIQLAVELLGPDGASLATFNEEVGPTGEQTIAFVADAAGTYTVLVDSPLKNVPSGSYSLQLVELRAAQDDDRSLFEARKLHSQSERLSQAGKYEEALRLTERAMEIVEKLQGMDQVYLAVLIRNVASLQWFLENTEKAQQFYERALAIFERTLGPEHPRTASTKAGLASLYLAAGEYDRAEQTLRQAIAVEEKTLGPEHPWLADSFRSLGALYSDRGDLDRAQEAYERAAGIAERTIGRDTLSYAQIQNNLGVLFLRRRDFGRAGPYLEKAMAIEEGLLGQDHLMLTYLLNNLGIVARELKNYELAAQHFTRALLIREKALGPEHPELAGNLINIASLYHSEGNYANSLETSSRALRILEKDGDTHDWTMVLILGNIARTYAAAGDFVNAVGFQARTDATIEQDLLDNLAIGSEHQKLAYFNRISDRTERTVSLNLQLAPSSSDASSLAALVLLKRKGRVLDAMTDSLGALQRRSDARDRALLEELKSTTEQIAKLSLNGPQKMSPEEFRERLKKLEERKEDLEGDISRHNLEFRAQSQSVTLESVQAAVPAKAALLEYVSYRPYDPKAPTSNSAFGGTRIAVYVIRSHGVPQGIDLGDAKAIQETVSRLREALRDPLKTDARDASRALDEKVMQPVRGLLGEVAQLLISPDGELNLIPFEALLDEQGHFLLQRYSISYLTTGRDLLRMQVARASKSDLLVIADPSFGEPETAQATNTGESKPHPSASARRSITTGADLSNVYFAPLSGTSEEARAIQTLFPEAQVFTGPRATKDSLRRMEAPRILHIATHGFFLQAPTPGSGQAAATPAPQGTRGIRAGTKIENPLLRSGLALAGANLNKENSTAENGILTALEVSNLNLWGTKLVTLSACDTGVGEVKNGEGVYGLRRAFFLAGTESLVMSLWPVSDYVTRELMTQYYTGLKKGLGRGEALRQAQLAMLKRKGRQHPFYWASFIQAGEWANLDGQR
jgi:CHAT domain-containing protein/Tfp pilus assembly protein PilF